MGSVEAQLRKIRAAAVDAGVLTKQALGLPGGRTRAQVAALKASFNDAELDPLRVALVAQASQRQPAEIEAFVDAFADLPYPGDVPLDGWAKPGSMSLRDCKTLHALVCAFEPVICVETGTAAGVSAAVILRNLTRRAVGRLYSIDVAGPRSAQYGALIPPDLRGRWELRLQDETPLLEELGTIDLFLHDSRHTYRHMRWEYELAWPHIRAGGCLASHDVITTAAFEEFVRNHADTIAHSGTIGNLGFIIKA